MKNKLMIPVFLASLFMVAGCSSSASFTPSHGGQIDTLHNEIHVGSLEELNELSEDKHGKDPTKVYYTDNDGLKYKYDAETGTYICISEYTTTINFYFDNTQTTDEDGNDAPIFTLRWYLLKPIGEIPEEINTTAKVVALGAALGFASTEAFPTFIGFSAYSTCLDEDQLWNYETDYRQQAVTNLYGIWVG